MEIKEAKGNPRILNQELFFILSVKPSTKDNKYYIYSESNSLVD